MDLQVVQRLMDALGTPSEMVQRTISTSLASLVPKTAVKPNGPIYIKQLLQTLMTTPSYAERRGAAFGIAGVIKGLGIPALKQHGVMAALQAAIEDKGKGEMIKKIKKEEARLHARTIDELKALLEYLDVTFDPDLEDKERLVALVINQKNLVPVAENLKEKFKGMKSVLDMVV